MLTCGLFTIVVVFVDVISIVYEVFDLIGEELNKLKELLRLYNIFFACILEDMDNAISFILFILDIVDKCRMINNFRYSLYRVIM
jgi:hypothetical protein